MWSLHMTSAHIKPTLCGIHSKILVTFLWHMICDEFELLLRNWLNIQYVAKWGSSGDRNRVYIDNQLLFYVNKSQESTCRVTSRVLEFIGLTALRTPPLSLYPPRVSSRDCLILLFLRNSPHLLLRRRGAASFGLSASKQTFLDTAGEVFCLHNLIPYSELT